MNWAQRPMAGAFLNRLRQTRDFGVTDFAALSAAPVEVRIFDANMTIVAEGARTDRIHVVLDGWAARSKILENGSRQIPALFVAGDVSDLEALHFDHNDCGTTALTPCTVALFGRDHLRTMLDRHRGLREAISRLTATQNAIATQWTVCLGRRSARERLAHLLCELFVRLDAVGAAESTGCALPLTQEELADVLGLTAVHVNRTLQGLRGDGLIQLKDQRLTIGDWPQLTRTAGFDSDYLHLADDRPRRVGGTAARPHIEARISA